MGYTTSQSQQVVDGLIELDTTCPDSTFVLDAWPRRPGRAPRLGIVIIDIGNPVSPQ
jgi:hypothetical protein